MLHNAVVLYRRTITFSYIVSTNHSKSRLHIPYKKVDLESLPEHQQGDAQTEATLLAVKAVQVEHIMFTLG